MANYFEMYLTLFRAVTKSIELLEQIPGADKAVEILKEAQQTTEEMYIE